MKKLLIVLAFAGVCMSSMAQDADPTLKYSVATNSFWSNWFIQANANWSAFYSNSEHGANLAKSPIKDFRSTPGFSVALGKWFTPGIGLRTKFYGIRGRQVQRNENKHSYKYWNIEEQALLNLSNIFCGYNPSRVWNFSVFAGAGVDRNWDNRTYSMSYSLGLMNQWRLSDCVGLNLELGWLYKEHDADGLTPGKGKVNAIYWESHDQQLYAELGLTFNLGKTGWNKTPDVDAIKALSQAQIDALNAQLADANAENARNYSSCDSLLLGSDCGAHTFPYMDVHNDTAIVEHEATTSKISEDQLFYCNQRGIPTEDAVGLIVNGYAKDVLNKLPMEFAVEAQKLLSVSLEGTVG